MNMTDLNQLQPLNSHDQKLFDFIERHHLISPQQLALALKLQRQSQGRLDMILWQLGFIDSQDLAKLLQLRYA